jgi:hypothetical protein
MAAGIMKENTYDGHQRSEIKKIIEAIIAIDA